MRDSCVSNIILHEGVGARLIGHLIEPELLFFDYRFGSLLEGTVSIVRLKKYYLDLNQRFHFFIDLVLFNLSYYFVQVIYSVYVDYVIMLSYFNILVDT